MHTASVSQIGLGIGSFLLCVLALFACASHSRTRWRKWKSCYVFGNREPVIQLNHEDVITGYHYGEADPSAYSGEVSTLWKKNILMGGKCQLPDFSGVIIYDSVGNVVDTGKSKPKLPWK
ncbi:Unknown protein [Striga hermonthica]|uniref:Uncharacterized protein n=1 Tax=Striga hermonthica TaxID=68872 RepID=A0A9N7NZ09_STRHE|nr:Unknown protein [Striga hermonthica]